MLWLDMQSYLLFVLLCLVVERKFVNFYSSLKECSYLNKRTRRIKMKIIGVIPARYKSSRFPGKPLVDICGRPMIWWVYQQCKKVEDFDLVYFVKIL